MTPEDELREKFAAENGIDPATLPLSMAEACCDPRLSPAGRPLSYPCLWRLKKYGTLRKDGRQIVLGTVATGRGRFVTRATIAKFIEELNEPTVKPIVNGIALRSHAEATARLLARGIGTPENLAALRASKIKNRRPTA